MSKLLKIQILPPPFIRFNSSTLFNAIKSEIQQKYEVYDSRSFAETIQLLDKHHFQAILIVTWGSPLNQKLLQHRLSRFIHNGGTLILTSRCYDAGSYYTPESSHSNLCAEFALTGVRTNNYVCYYILNETFDCVFGPSVYERLTDVICTDAQMLDNVPDSAMIYKSEPGGQCAAAFMERGYGFIGYLGDTAEGSAAQTLLLAMLEHAIEHGIFVPTPNTRPSLPTLLFNKVASHGPPSSLPRLIDANPGCAVCHILVPAKKCGECHLVQYCSTKCQRADWESHQVVCIAAEEDEDTPSTTGQSTFVTAQESSAEEELLISL
ncbi:hypothetical protein MMC07_004271 [Pseudocyphellaria aurata]|nr:hypothetical protein [Pseudocyphellaria aurata]